MASWPGARSSPGNSSRKSASEPARAAVRASVRRQSSRHAYQFAPNCCSRSRPAHQPRAAADSPVRGPTTRSTSYRRPSRFFAPGNRPTRVAVVLAAGTGLRADRGSARCVRRPPRGSAPDVWRMRRAADAVCGQVCLANLGMDAKDQLDRVGEVERKVAVAGLAMGVLGDRAQGVLGPARDAADRAEQVPVRARAVLRARRGDSAAYDLVGIEPKSLGQGQRPDPRDLLIGALWQGVRPGARRPQDRRRPTSTGSATARAAPAADGRQRLVSPQTDRTGRQTLSLLPGVPASMRR